MIDTQKSMIYHYTTFQGFMGIIQNQGFWMSCARFLNDTGELEYGYNLCKKYAKELFEEERIRENRNMEFKKTLNNTFVTCFSKDGDSLDQWKGYGQQGMGISIGIDRDYFVNSLFVSHPHKIDLLDISYEIKEQKKLIEERGENLKKRCIIHTGGDFSQTLPRLLPASFKHKCYKQEKEVRLVFYQDTQKIIEPHFREKNGILIPYICSNELFQLISKNKIPYLPIKKVTIGPTVNQAISKESIIYFLSESGYKNAEKIVVNSIVPFRG